MSNIDKRAREKLKSAASKAVDNFDPNMFVETRDMLALLDELEAAEKRIAELQNDEVRQRLANAEHQLHMAELAKHNMRAGRKAQFRKRKAAERRIAELEVREELFLRAKALMHQSGGAPIENSLNPIDAWLYDAEHAAAGKGAAS